MQWVTYFLAILSCQLSNSSSSIKWFSWLYPESFAHDSTITTNTVEDWNRDEKQIPSLGQLLHNTKPSRLLQHCWRRSNPSLHPSLHRHNKKSPPLETSTHSAKKKQEESSQTWPHGGAKTPPPQTRSPDHSSERWRSRPLWKQTRERARTLVASSRCVFKETFTPGC